MCLLAHDCPQMLDTAAFLEPMTIWLAFNLLVTL